MAMDRRPRLHSREANDVCFGLNPYREAAQAQRSDGGPLAADSPLSFRREAMQSASHGQAQALSADAAAAQNAAAPTRGRRKRRLPQLRSCLESYGPNSELSMASMLKEGDVDAETAKFHKSLREKQRRETFKIKLFELAREAGYSFPNNVACPDKLLLVEYTNQKFSEMKAANAKLERAAAHALERNARLEAENKALRRAQGAADAQRQAPIIVNINASAQPMPFYFVHGGDAGGLNLAPQYHFDHRNIDQRIDNSTKNVDNRNIDNKIIGNVEIQKNVHIGGDKIETNEKSPKTVIRTNSGDGRQTSAAERVAAKQSAESRNNAAALNDLTAVSKPSQNDYRNALSQLENGTIQFPRQNYPALSSAPESVEGIQNQIMRMLPAINCLKNDAMYSRNHVANNALNSSSYEENDGSYSPSGLSDQNSK